MKKDVSISVIIPVYNTEKYIDKCLESLVNQTFVSWHAVIVNDGSTDNSEDLCREYCVQYPDKFSLYSREHGGPGAARNFGIEKCGDTKYLYFLDSDDYLELTALEKLYNAVEETGAEMAVCGLTVHKNKKRYSFVHKGGVFTKKEVCYSLLENDNIGNYVCNKLFLRSLFSDLRFPENVFYEDVFTTYKIVLSCEKIAVISEALYNYIRHGGSIVTSYNLDYLKDWYLATEERNSVIIDKFPEFAEYDDVNKLGISINIWNQICRSRTLPKTSECQNILRFIQKNYKIYYRLDKRRKVMANIIRRFPRIYAALVFLYVKVHSKF